MMTWPSITILYVVGMGLLIAELFLPAHGVIGLAGLSLLGFGIYETYLLNTTAGTVGFPSPRKFHLFVGTIRRSTGC